MLNIIICGAPGSGKGTQSDLIVDKYTLTHLSTGDLLRNEIAKKTVLGVEAERYIANGNLVPDSMIVDIVLKAIDDQTKDSNGIILDGFPRNVEQAEALEAMMTQLNKEITILVDLQVDTEELISRLLIRGETSGRCDDNLETIKKRLEVYEVKTTPVNNFYKNRHKYAAVNGTGTVDEIFRRIATAIDAKTVIQTNRL